MEDIFERVPVIKLTVVNWIKNFTLFSNFIENGNLTCTTPAFDIIK